MDSQNIVHANNSAGEKTVRNIGFTKLIEKIKNIDLKTKAKDCENTLTHANACDILRNVTDICM